jgi:pre-mRNA-processing factor 17
LLGGLLHALAAGAGCQADSAVRRHLPPPLQDAHVGTFTFDEQYNTFHAYGYGVEPSGQGYVGDADALQSKNGACRGF